VRILLVVLEHDVESRPMLFDQVRFKHQRFSFVIDDYEFKVGDQFPELVRLPIRFAGLKIRPHAVAKILGLTDVDDLAHRIFMNVYARGGRKCFELFLKRHITILH